MKIIAPLDNVKEVDKLIEAGADEIYCGVYSKKAGYPSLNARQSYFANVDSFATLKRIVDITHSSGKRLILCVNTYPIYKYIDILKDNIKKALDLGIRFFIVADPTIMCFIKKISPDANLIVSSLNPVFNFEAIELFKEIGANRIVLPRHLKLGEIYLINKRAESLGIEVEVFVLNNICRNINGKCLFHKMSIEKRRFFGSSLKNVFNWREVYTYNLTPFQHCRKTFVTEVMWRNRRSQLEKKIVEDFVLDGDIASYCGLCSIYFLKRFGVQGVKIVGRGYLTSKKVKDVTAIKKFIEEVERGRADSSNFMDIGKDIFTKVYGMPCRDMQCHHYEIYNIRKRRDNAI